MASAYTPDGLPPSGHTWGRVTLVASTAGVVACAVVIVLSYIPSVPATPTAVWGILFAGIFPVHLRSVILLRQRRTDLRQAFARPDLQLKRFPWLGLVGAVCLVAFLTSMSSLQGQPTIVHGSYFLDDHGSLIHVTHDAYLRALSAQGRSFAAVACVFYSLAVAVNRAVA